MPHALQASTLRPFQPTDYPQLHALHRQLDPSFAVAVEELQHQDQARRHEPQARLVLERDHRLLAAVAYTVKKPSEAHYRLEFLVPPTIQSFDETAERLYHAITAQLAHLRPRDLSVLVREDAEALLAFFGAQGFTELERQILSRLDLTTFDPDLGALEPGPDLAGIRIVSRAELPDPSGETSLRRLYELVVALLEDVPHAEALDIWPFEVWRARSQTPARRPEGCFLAVAGDSWVGLSELLLSDRPGHLRTSLTGVRRGWRGRGLATALKRTALTHAKGQGMTMVTTSNHDANRAMLAINERLGFVRQPAVFTYLRTLVEGPAGTGGRPRPRPGHVVEGHDDS